MREPRIITKKPWWWIITGKNWGDVAMTWGNNIYIHEDKIREDVIVHEKVHVRQHKGNWFYALYIFIRSTFSKEFYDRLEFEAYIEQYDYLKKHENNRDNGSRTKRKISK